MFSRSRWLSLALVVSGALAGAGLAALASTGDPIDPPPRIAFVARGDVAADALAVGPVAGRLDAPVFTTPSDVLADAAREGLLDHDPDLVIIAGGPSAISAETEAQIEAALGLADDRVVRAAGADRYETALQIAGLLYQYNPAFLPTDGTAVDAEHLDGLPVAGLNPFASVRDPDPGSGIISTGAATWQPVPDASTTVEIPDGHTGYVVVRFSGLAYCGIEDPPGAEDPPGVDGDCFARLLVDGADPFDQPDGTRIAYSQDMPGTQSLDVVAGPLGAGMHTVIVQYRVQANTDVHVAFDMWTLTAEVKLNS
jgi:hypothetical protein